MDKLTESTIAKRPHKHVMWDKSTEQPFRGQYTLPHRVLSSHGPHPEQQSSYTSTLGDI